MAMSVISTNVHETPEGPYSRVGPGRYKAEVEAVSEADGSAMLGCPKVKFLCFGQSGGFMGMIDVVYHVTEEAAELEAREMLARSGRSFTDDDVIEKTEEQRTRALEDFARLAWAAGLDHKAVNPEELIGKKVWLCVRGQTFERNGKKRTVGFVESRGYFPPDTPPEKVLYAVQNG